MPHQTILCSFFPHHSWKNMGRSFTPNKEGVIHHPLALEVSYLEVQTSLLFHHPCLLKVTDCKRQRLQRFFSSQLWVKILSVKNTKGIWDPGSFIHLKHDCAENMDAVQKIQTRVVWLMKQEWRRNPYWSYKICQSRSEYLFPWSVL